MSIGPGAMIDEDWSGVDAALSRAFQRALELGRRTGTPVWIIEDGRVVNVLADEREGRDEATGGEETPLSA